MHFRVLDGQIALLEENVNIFFFYLKCFIDVCLCNILDQIENASNDLNLK